jgi:hypothetical protein
MNQQDRSSVPFFILQPSSFILNFGSRPFPGERSSCLIAGKSRGFAGFESRFPR